MDDTGKKPGLFIVGAAKAGTTSLYNYLDKHPDIYFSPLKEPNYFCTDIKVEGFCRAYRKNTFLDNDKYFNDLPLKPLQLAFVRKQEQYNALFAGAKHEKILGEASTSYLYSREAAQKIYDYNRHAKIIMVLRDPVERAFSHYLMALRYGFTHLSFRKALEKDLGHPDKGWGKSELFIELGLYYGQIQRYLDVFPEKQVKIFLFDQLKNDPSGLMDECFEFLGLGPLTIQGFREHNKALVPGSNRLNTLAVNSGIKNMVKKIVSESTKNRLKKLFYNNRFPVLKETDKQFLLEIYGGDIQKTSVLIKMDLRHWLK